MEFWLKSRKISKKRPFFYLFFSSVWSKVALDKLQFTHMAPEIQLLVLEQLNITDLISMAQTNSRFYHLALNVYRRKFQQKIIKIEEKSTFYERGIFANENHITFQNASKASGFLRLFGHLITKLEIFDMQMNIDDAELIAENVNRFCSTSLLQFEMYNSPNIWDKMEGPFRNVENVTFKNQIETSEYVNLTEIFPNVRRLSLEYIHSHNEYTFDVHFPHLEHFTIGFISHEIPGRSFTKRNFQTFSQLNRQIRGLHLMYMTYEALVIANQNFMDLEYLELSWPNWRGVIEYAEVIRFENVKRLALIFSDYIPESVVFPQLEEMEIICSSKLTDKCIEFIGKRTTVKKLHIHNIVHAVHTPKLSAILPDLIELSMNWERDVSSESILNLAEQHTQLKSLHLTYLDESMGKELNEEVNQTRYKHIWECIDVNQNGRKPYRLILRRII